MEDEDNRSGNMNMLYDSIVQSEAEAPAKRIGELNVLSASIVSSQDDDEDDEEEAAPPPAKTDTEKWTVLVLVKRKRWLVSGIVMIIILIVVIIGTLVAFSGEEKGSPSLTSDVQAQSPPRPLVPSNSPPPPFSSSLPISAPSSGPPAPVPSQDPPVAASRRPTLGPTAAPSELLTQVTTFFAIGDVPYNPAQAIKLSKQLTNIPGDADFVIHVGDLRRATNDTICRRIDYSDAAAIFRLSPVPVFVILGDNDWTDCPNINQGWKFWQQEFNGFEGMHWNHTFDIVRQPRRTENFAFVHKRTLFIGLNIVGGRVHDRSEWTTRLSEQVEWTMDLIREYHSVGPDESVVIFGHADPTKNHDAFFGPFTDFVADELQNELPILYLNGDKHEWLHQPNFFGQPSFLRLMLTGRTVDPPLKVSVVNSGKGGNLQIADRFPFDRQLD